MMIELHTGPMGGGKSAALLDIADRFYVIAIQSPANSRDGSTIRSRDGRSIPARVVASLTEDARSWPHGSTVVVDEGQWWTAEDWRRALVIASARGVDRVAIAALELGASGDYLGSARELMGLARQVERHHARCVDCGGLAGLTRWDGEGPPGVGDIGPGAYRPVCAEHWRAPGWGYSSPSQSPQRG